MALSAAALAALPSCAEGEASGAVVSGVQQATGTAAQTAAALAVTSAAASTKAAAAAAKPWPEPLPVEAGGARIYSKARHLWVRQEPVNGEGWIGYLSMGDSVRLVGGDAEAAFVGPGSGQDCERWYAVEPVGYVCAGERGTLDAEDPTVVELVRRRAKRESPWPYRYGESLGLPVYPAPPSRAKQRRRELGLDDYLDKVERAREVGSDEERAAIDERFVGMDFAPAGKGPPALLDMPPAGRVIQTRVVQLSTLAYVDELDYEGRTFLLTWDGGYVPKDKVRPYPEVDFHGVVLDGKQQLPIAFFRGEARPKYRLGPDGRFVDSGQRWPRLGWVGLAGSRRAEQGEEYLETREAGMWTRASEATVAEQASELPRRLQGVDDGRRSWLDVSITGGTLVAYEQLTPVYATLISPGRGGPPFPGVPTLDTASTPVGEFQVLGKFVTATMQSGSISTLIHSEVPFTMNFDGPYAVHSAYWHDRFGEPKSGGCVNLAPLDAQRIFEWSEPRLPQGWHGMRTFTKPDLFGPKTVVRIRR